MKKVYGDYCICRTQIYTWFTGFKIGYKDLNDVPRSGHPEGENRNKSIEKNL